LRYGETTADAGEHHRKHSRFWASSSSHWFPAPGPTLSPARSMPGLGEASPARRRVAPRAPLGPADRAAL